MKISRPKISRYGRKLKRNTPNDCFSSRARTSTPLARSVVTQASFDSNGNSVVKWSKLRPRKGSGVLKLPFTCCRSAISTVSTLALSRCSVHCEQEMSTVSCRRFAAHWTRAIAQERDQSVEGVPRIDDIVDQQDVLTPQLCFRVVQQPDIPTRHRIGAVARRHQEVHLERPLDAAHEIAQENEASPEETEHQQLTVGVGRGDLLAELADPARDRLLVEDDALELTPARLLEARCAW